MQDYKSSVKLIEKIVVCLNEIWHENKESFDDYFSIETAKAVNEIFITNHIQKVSRKSKERQEIIFDFDKLKTMSLYEFTDDKQVNIFIPEIRGIDDNYETAKLEILVGDKIIYNKECYIVGKELKKRLKRITVPLAEIIKEFKSTFNLRTKLYFDDTIIFDSKKKLYREFILFRNSRELRGDCRPDIYFLVHALDANLSKMTNCIYSGISSNHIVALSAQEGQYISYLNKTIFLTVRNKIRISLSNLNQPSAWYMLKKVISLISFLKYMNAQFM